MACNWLMMTSSGEDNGPWEFGSAYRQKKKPKAEQETAQPTTARFNKNKKLKTTFNRAFKIELFSKYLATAFCE